MGFVKGVFHGNSISKPTHLFKYAFVQNKPEQLLKHIHLLKLFSSCALI